MRQRKDFQRIEGVKSSRLIVIAAEGRATENIYFEAMRQELCATNVQLVVLNREDDKKNLFENPRLSTHGTWTKYHLRKLMGHYQESDYDPSILLLHVEEAICRAEKLDINPKDRWPQTTGTRVYLLAKSIMDR